MFKFLKTACPLEKLDKERSKYLQGNQLPAYLKENIDAPLPEKETDTRTLTFLVVDFETTGFEPESSDIISVGWIEISNMQIDFASQQHFYINNEHQINHETAVINHIVPQMVRDGVSLELAIEKLLRAAKGKILVAHGKIIEQHFLDFYVQQKYKLPELPLMWIDTLLIEKWRSVANGKQLTQDNRLSSARQRYNLPEYAAHNALIDSIATAELLLAQIAHLYLKQPRPIEHLFKISQ